ncbi:MAG: hypothetical protein Q8S02_03750 [Hydrogenophaga sp.]|nr:hypothetical protein [Hydrogenophaga sp.]
MAHTAINTSNTDPVAHKRMPLRRWSEIVMHDLTGWLIADLDVERPRRHGSHRAFQAVHVSLYQ